MKINDISIADQVCIKAMGEDNIAIIGDITENKNFECFQVFTKDNEYIFSLTEDTVEDNDTISKELKNEISNSIKSLGGIDRIISDIQNLYNSKIENEELYGTIYRDLGKDNIKEYCKIDNII